MIGLICVSMAFLAALVVIAAFAWRVCIADRQMIITQMQERREAEEAYRLHLQELVNKIVSKNYDEYARLETAGMVFNPNANPSPGPDISEVEPFGGELKDNQVPVG